MSGEYQNHLPIKCWAEDERPREKLLTKGKSALSDAELLAIVLGSGTRRTSAVDLARELLEHSQNNLIELGKQDHGQLTGIRGIGPAKALLVEAALELGRRRQFSEALQKAQVCSSQDAYQLVKSKLQDLSHEEFWVLFLSKSNKMIALENFSKGGLTGTVADARIIFRRALDCRCTGLILIHNHPSGTRKPSNQDVELTHKMKQAAQHLDLAVLDHIIVADDKYYSFADEGLL